MSSFGDCLSLDFAPLPDVSFNDTIPLIWKPMSLLIFITFRLILSDETRSLCDFAAYVHSHLSLNFFFLPFHFIRELTFS